MAPDELIAPPNGLQRPRGERDDSCDDENDDAISLLAVVLPEMVRDEMAPDELIAPPNGLQRPRSERDDSCDDEDEEAHSLLAVVLPEMLLGEIRGDDAWLALTRVLWCTGHT